MSDKKRTSYPKEKINILLLENISEQAVQNFKKAGYKVISAKGKYFFVKTIRLRAE